MRGGTIGQTAHGLGDGVFHLGHTVRRKCRSLRVRGAGHRCLHMRCRCSSGLGLWLWPHHGLLLLQMGHVGTFIGLGHDDACRDAHGRRPSGHRLEHHGIGANLGAVAHLKTAQHLGASGHHHIAPQGGMALGALVQRGAAQRDAVVNGATIADHGGFANHHAHAVVDEDALANHRTGVDFNAGEPAPNVRDKTAQPLETMRPAPVRGAMPPDGVQTGVAGDDFPSAARGRIALKNALDVGTQA